MLTPIQQKTILAITSVFETGSPRADYSACTVLADGAGISYGAHQATEGSGTLRRVLERYDKYTSLIVDGEPAWAVEVLAGRPITDRARAMDTLPFLAEVKAMQRAQDEIFSEDYFVPAVAYAERCGCRWPLTVAFIYDTMIHSGAGRLRKLRRTFEDPPPSNMGIEHRWITQLVMARHEWLSTYTSSNAKKQALIRSTAWRPLVYRHLLDEGDDGWHLELPLAIYRDGETYATIREGDL